MARVKSESDLDLFDVPANLPEGFLYRRDFVSKTEEQELIKEIQKLTLVAFKYYQFTGKRRTATFGWQYEFGNNDIIKAPDLPEFLLPLRERAGKLFKMDVDSLVQASIVEYPLGAPIGWHRDIPQFGIIIGVSLAGACRMRLREYRRPRSKTSRRGEAVSIELEPRSIYLMSGSSRQRWQHSIPPVKESRYSVVMRTLRS
ncbi:MAG TPA: alpha-ketoglutarate-dependent dioxygenase AlkB [Candidatus Binatia bacterium]|jgi:alkylated DNA repair dioxygenase AlkB